MDVRPFRALRYDPAVAGDPARTSAPAYDALEPLAYASHREASPYTVLELHAPDGAYQRAATLYRRWLRSGVLVPDEGPALYRYEEHELVAGVPRVQRGLLAAVRLCPLDGSGDVLPHEDVDPARVTDRLRRVEEVPVELTPVHALVEDPPAQFAELLGGSPHAPPVVAATDERGTDHRIWAIRDPSAVSEVAQALKGSRAVIADGHHRWARSVALRDRRRARESRGDEAPWERTLVYLVGPTDGPRVEAIHRLLQPVAPRQLARLAQDFVMEPAPGDARQLEQRLAGAPPLSFGLVEPGGTGRVLVPRDPASLRVRLPAERRAAWSQLDAAVLTHAVLPALGLPASAVHPRTDSGAAVREVASTDDAALLVVRPMALDDVIRLAGAGQRLPPKTTRFLPKPRSGLVLRSLEDAP